MLRCMSEQPNNEQHQPQVAKLTLVFSDGQFQSAEQEGDLDTVNALHMSATLHSLGQQSMLTYCASLQIGLIQLSEVVRKFIEESKSANTEQDSPASPET